MTIVVRHARSWRWCASALAVLFLTGACSSGSGAAGDGADEGSADTSAPTTIVFVQKRFVPDFAADLFVAFQVAVGEHFPFDGESDVVVDLTEGEIENPGERMTFARDRGLLGYYAGEFVAPQGQQLWGLTSEVFRDAEGAKATWDRYGNVERVDIDDATKLGSSEADVGGGREGRIFVDEYGYDDGTRTFVMRGTLVDGNVLHHVLGIVDVGAGEIFDAGDAVRSNLTSVEGVLRKRYDAAAARGAFDEEG